MDSRRTPGRALSARETARGTISQCVLDLGIIAQRLDDQADAPLPQLARQLDVLANEPTRCANCKPSPTWPWPPRANGVGPPRPPKRSPHCRRWSARQSPRARTPWTGPRWRN